MITLLQGDFGNSLVWIVDVGLITLMQWKWNRFQIKTVFGNDDDFHLKKKKPCFHFRWPNVNFTDIFLTWFWLLNLIRGAMWRCINNYYKGEIHWSSLRFYVNTLRFYVNTQSKYSWHLRNYNDLPWGLHLIQMPLDVWEIILTTSELPG